MKSALAILAIALLAPAAAELQAALNMHQTSLGYAGHVTLGDGAAAPIRNVRTSDASLSFIVPAFDATFQGQLDPAGNGWIGTWTQGGVEAPLRLDRSLARLDAAPASPYARPQRLVALADGRRMNLYCLGAGSPTVVLDYGAGGSAADWSSVHARLAETTRVCAYDRAGQGFSDPGPLPRDASAVVEDLAATLRAGGVTGPYILVGHSLGSLHVRLFADRRLPEVAGMVLVDPSGDHQAARLDKAVPKLAEIRGSNDGLRRCIALAREGLVRRDSETFRQCRQNDPDLMESRLSEAESMETSSSAQTTAERRSYGDLPLVVLTRGDNRGAPPQLTSRDLAAYNAVWTQMHDEFAALSTMGMRRTVEDAGHYIHRDKPEAVIAAVNEVVARARGSAR